MDNEWKIVEMDGRQYREMTRTEKAESGGDGDAGTHCP